MLAVKLPEPKPFYGDHKLARAWMSVTKRYFIAVGLDEDEAAHSERMVQICCALMQGNAACWMDRLELQGEAPASIQEFQSAFRN